MSADVAGIGGRGVCDGGGGGGGEQAVDGVDWGTSWSGGWDVSGERQRFKQAADAGSHAGGARRGGSAGGRLGGAVDPNSGVTSEAGCELTTCRAHSGEIDADFMTLCLKKFA